MVVPENYFSSERNENDARVDETLCADGALMDHHNEEGTNF